MDEGKPPGTAKSLKRIEFLILAVLKEGHRHGYGIVQEIAQRTGGEVRIRPGSLYRVLDRLLGRELLELADASPAEDERRTNYRITAAGRDAVVAEARILSRMAGAIVGTAGSEG